jgi:two-component system, NtrC family, nitrogen regulation sensor histidine kinase NtrY
MSLSSSCTPRGRKVGVVRIKSTGSSTSVILVVMVLFYVLLIGVIIFFSQQIILNLSTAQPLASTLVIAALIILPAALFVMIVINVVRLFRDRYRKTPGARFKLRLILFFSLIAVLSAVPQTTLAITFLNSLINAPFIAQINDVFKSAWNIARIYYRGKADNLKTFGSSPILAQIMRKLPADPAAVWEAVTSVNPEIEFFQVFDAQGRETHFSSREGVAAGARLPVDVTDAPASGLLPKAERGTVTGFRDLYVSHSPGPRSYAVFGITLPTGFEEDARRLTDSKEIFEQLSRFKDILQTGILLFYFFFSFPILLLSIIVSFLLSEEIIRPIINLEEATRRVAQGDLSIRILARSGDELSNLIDSFNGMVSELDSSKKKLLKTEKIAAWQEIAQRLAHEIKNPLTPIKLAAERIRKKFEEPGRSESELRQVVGTSVQAIILEVNNLDKMLREFTDFAKVPDPKRERVNLKALVEEAVSVYSTLASRVRMDLTFVDPELSLYIDPRQMKQVLANLFMNAFQAMPEGGELFIRADLVKKGKTDYCRIQVRDTGKGIDEAIQGQVFNPYFTTTEGGTGLGLSIVERIIFDHNGNVWFETKKGVGTTFFIDLPVENV